MTSQVAAALAGTLLCLTTGLLMARRAGRARRRLRALSPTPRAPRRVTNRRLAGLVAVLAGVAVAVVMSGWLGLLAGAVTAFLVDRAVRRIEPPGVRAARERARADLPYALDLTAAALAAGAPPAVAARAVGTALGGQLGERLDRAGRGLELGAPPADAWSALDDIPGGQRFGAVIVRGSRSGAALARSLRRLAEDLRSARLAEMESAAHRAGVLIVLPLGLCFLPAFVAGGLVPVVISMLGTVLP